MTVVDLSHVLADGLVTYQGAVPVRLGAHLTREDSRDFYAPGTEFQIDRVDMAGPSGTYMDAPFHRYADGTDLADLPISSLVNLPGRVFRAGTTTRAVDAPLFEGTGLKGRAVLIRTGWSVHFGTPQYFEGHYYLTRGAAECLADGGAALLGIDSMNVDDTGDPARPVHSILLGAGIPIIENMTGLDRLPEDGFRFFAAPVKIRGGGSFPVRAFAIPDDRTS